MTLYANMGAPMGRQIIEPIKSSLLGDRDGFIRCPTVVQVGLAFGSRRAFVSALENLLPRVGCRSSAELLDIFNIPVGRLIARPAPKEFQPCRLDVAPPEVVLRHALILGLSTAHIYDPERPVLWTQASVSRRLELCDPGGFYQ